MPTTPKNKSHLAAIRFIEEVARMEYAGELCDYGLNATAFKRLVRKARRIRKKLSGEKG